MSDAVTQALVLLHVARELRERSLAEKGRWLRAERDARGRWEVDYLAGRLLREAFARASELYGVEASVVLEEAELSFHVSRGECSGELRSSSPTFFVDPVCYSSDHTRWLVVGRSCFPTRAFFIGGWARRGYREARLTDVEVGLHYSLGTGSYFLGLRTSGGYVTLLDGLPHSLPTRPPRRPVVALPWYSNERFDLAGAVARALSRKYRVFMGTGGTALDQALLFEGRVEGVVDLRALLARDSGAALMPHDVVAIYPIARGLGIAVTDLEGRELGVRVWGEEPVSLVAARGELHGELLEDVRKAVEALGLA